MFLLVQNHEPQVAETAVVGYPHEIFGEGRRFVVLFMHVCVCCLGVLTYTLPSYTCMQ